MNKMPIRVLDLRESPYIGGINGSLINIISEISTRPEIEFNSAVLAEQPAGWLFDRMLLLGMRISWIPCHGPTDLAILYRLRDFINAWKPDVIHTHGYRPDIYIRSLLDLKMISLPVVITKHGMLVISRFRLWLYSRLDRRPMRLADRVIAVDGATLEKLVTEWRVPRERVWHIPNAVRPFMPPGQEEIQILRYELGIDEERPILLYIGRLEPTKGLRELLEVHQQLHDLGKPSYLLFVGDGPYRANLEAMCKNFQAGHRVLFAGSQLQVDKFLALSDMLILPSYSEGMPVVILEAMSAAKPVIATNVGGIPELITHGENGIIIPPHDPSALAQAILALIENPRRRNAMGERGKARADALYSPKRIVGEMVKLYTGIARNSRNK